MVGRQGCPSQPLQARHSSPEMGSSSDAAQRLALKLQAVYNYPLFLSFFPPGGRYLQSRALGLGVLAAAALPPYMCGS